MTDFFDRYIRPYSLPLLAGFFHGTSYIPFFPWALFFCLVPLWLFWLQSRAKTLFWGTCLCFFVGTLIGFHWIIYTVHDFGKMPWAVSALVLLAFALLANIQFAFAGLTWKFLTYKTRGHFKLVLLPLITACFSYFFSTIFPWNYGYPWIYAQLPGVQFADIVGMDGISTLTIFFNFLIFLAFYKKNYLVYLGSFAVIFVAFNFFGFLHKMALPRADKSLHVLLVQANIGNLDKQHSLHSYRFKDVVQEKYTQLTLKGLAETQAPVDLVVWPETAYPKYVLLEDFMHHSPELYTLAKDNEVNFITGFYDFPANSEHPANAILYINKQGQLSDKPTHKTILLAFGEYLPGAQWFPSLKKYLPMVSSFKRGSGPALRSLSNYRIAPLICYETLFPNFARKMTLNNAHFFVNLTNDSWYGKYFEPKQHLYMSAGRAIENRIPLIRATNTGHSTVILESGEILQTSPMDVEWTGSFKVPYHSQAPKTHFQKWGYWAHIIFLILSVIVFTTYGWLKYYYDRS